MIRRIIQIDQARCTGCGRCAAACHEGAIAMVGGKARLMRDDYCDGLGDCLPSCPAGAITFVEREAAPYDESAVQAAKQKKAAFTCPSVRAQAFAAKDGSAPAPSAADDTGSMLRQWPVQIKLTPIRAPFFSGADLLIAADCTAYACGDFHKRFLCGRVCLIGCPKLDGEDYTDKLAAILTDNMIKSVTLVRMEVPCCGGLERAAAAAIRSSGKDIPLRTVIVTAQGAVSEK